MAPHSLHHPLHMRLQRYRCLGTKHIAEIVSKPEIQAGERQHHVAFVSTEGKCQEADAAPFIRCTTCNPLPHPHGDCHSPSAHHSQAEPALPRPFSTAGPHQPLPAKLQLPAEALPTAPQPAWGKRDPLPSNLQETSSQPAVPTTALHPE